MRSCFYWGSARACVHLPVRVPAYGHAWALRRALLGADAVHLASVLAVDPADTLFAGWV